MLLPQVGYSSAGSDCTTASERRSKWKGWQAIGEEEELAVEQHKDIYLQDVCMLSIVLEQRTWLLAISNTTFGLMGSDIVASEDVGIVEKYC